MRMRMRSGGFSSEGLPEQARITATPQLRRRRTPTMPARTLRKPPSKQKTGKPAAPTEPRLSRTRRPPELPLVDWQTALRRQFAYMFFYIYKQQGGGSRAIRFITSSYMGSQYNRLLMPLR